MEPTLVLEDPILVLVESAKVPCELPASGLYYEVCNDLVYVPLTLLCEPLLIGGPVIDIDETLDPCPLEPCPPEPGPCD